MSRYRWEMRPTEINAYYSAQSNKIGEYVRVSATLHSDTLRVTVRDCAWLRVRRSRCRFCRNAGNLIFRQNNVLS